MEQEKCVRERELPNLVWCSKEQHEKERECVHTNPSDVRNENKVT